MSFKSNFQVLDKDKAELEGNVAFCNQLLDAAVEETLAEEPPTLMAKNEMTVQDDLFAYDIVFWDSIKRELVTVPQDEKTIYQTLVCECKVIQQDIKIKQEHVKQACLSLIWIMLKQPGKKQKML